MAKKRKREELSEEELEKAHGEPLPERKAMSVIRSVEPLPQPVVIDNPGSVEPVPGEIYLDDPPTT